MTAKVRLYYDLMSQPSRALYIFLHLAKIPFEGVPVALRKGEHLTEEFAAINRFKKVPCITDGDFKLSESIAILRYLDAKYSIPDHLYPKQLEQRARVDEYLEWQHFNTRLNVASYFRLRYIQPLLLGKPSDEKALAQAAKARDSTLNLFESAWLGQNKFIVGNTLSVADLFAACEIEQSRCGDFDPGNGRPLLQAWLKSVKENLDPLYSEAHKYIWSFGRNAKL